MHRLWMTCLFLLMFGFSCQIYAHQQSSGGGTDDLKGVCELAGGSWTGSGNNWACCWADWGCYGCVDGVCKMQCRTKRCRDANRVRQTSRGTKTVKGLAPAGAKAPIAPMRSKKQ